MLYGAGIGREAMHDPAEERRQVGHGGDDAVRSDEGRVERVRGTAGPGRAAA
jgi:hypothetical protein